MMYGVRTNSVFDADEGAKRWKFISACSTYKLTGLSDKQLVNHVIRRKNS